MAEAEKKMKELVSDLLTLDEEVLSKMPVWVRTLREICEGAMVEAERKDRVEERVDE